MSHGGIRAWGGGGKERAAVVAAGRGVLAALRCGRLGVDVAMVEAGEMSRLNARFRGKRGPADVLSFALPAADPGGAAGEVYLCPERISRRTGRGARYYRRLAELTAHGVLHVLGYHHSDPVAEAQMFALQRAVLRRVSAE